MSSVFINCYKALAHENLAGTVCNIIFFEHIYFS